MIERGSSIHECARIFHEQEDFIKHLRSDHLCEEAEISRRRESGRVGNNYQTSYWCGFCRKIIRQVDKRGSEAQNERYDHIDDYHFKKGQRIHEWYPIGGQVPRGEQSGKKAFGQNQEEEDSEESEEEPPPPPAPPAQPVPPQRQSEFSRSGHMPSPSYYQQNQADSHNISTMIEARMRTPEAWYCVSQHLPLRLPIIM